MAMVQSLLNRRGSHSLESHIQAPIEVKETRATKRVP
ncbi:hypothetical protein AGR13a_Cc240034 [Agrobacterium genomosp. 13 str. CFBP 6927]|uniref:Transposase n=1 Tax=Agrobacterium genomosp. 13 str. CFBP 6927 TaxID=1183428 RepID=A0ABP2BEZ8_9HYPH|nr:hypothetical protein AGR13a_Cc240034 [Agrobacterium genomosp. 13 str. CFBP 6927]